MQAMPALEPKLMAWLKKVQEDIGSPARGDAHPLDGCLLEGATVGSLLGVGSFAAVFELHDASNPRPLAVKVLERKQGAEQAATDEIFLREVDIGKRLDHPSIPRIYQVIERPHSRFVVLDRIQGQTWDAFLGQSLTPQRYRELFAPFASGLQYAHEMGVVHRDLKPENLMLSDDGAVKILDFGMARQGGAGDTSSTVTGQFKGTPMYCAPEQILDSKRVTSACDQFAFGLISYQLLTGQFPYELVASQPLQTLFKRLQTAASSLSSAWPQATPEADAAMARMLAMKPEDRFLSVQEAYTVFSSALPG